MRLLITGGCGYLGSAFIKHLNKNHSTDIDEIIIYDNLSKEELAFLFDHSIHNIPIKLHQHDILDRRSLLKSLQGVDTVIHLAANVIQPYTDLRLHEFDQVNNWGSSNVADAIEDSDVKHVIYMSSMTIYGSKDEVITEDITPEPMTYYGVSKRKGEKHFQRISNRDLHILRLANVYGYSPSMRVDSVFNRLMFEAHFKGKVNKIGDGSQSRAFISMKTFCDQLTSVLFKEVEPGIYNMAEANLSINEIIEIYLDLFPELEVFTLDQSAPLKNIHVSIPTKLSQQLGSPIVDVIEELKTFKEHFSF